ncbi:MAG: membrane protein insertase YidC [Vicinamibacteraceae bacterium]|nr:membrane protein insertase YidC [Vicinamibacteraceae bacterium]
MEKRVLLAITLSFVVLFAYQALFVKPKPAPAPASAPSAGRAADARPGQAGAAPAGTPPAAGTAASVEPSEAPTPAAPAPAAGAEPLVADTGERDIVVDTPEFTAVFSNRGGVLTSYRLKTFLDDAGRPIDLVPSVVPSGAARPFDLVFDDAGLTARVAEALFKPSDDRVDVGAGERTLTFEYQDAGGLAVVKRFDFQQDGQPYLLLVNAQATQGGQMVPAALASGPGLGDIARAAGGGSFFSPSYYQKTQGIFNQAGDVTRLSSDQLAEQPVHEGTFSYIGHDDHYFLRVALTGDRHTRVTYQPMTVQTEAGPRTLVSFDTRVRGGLSDVKVFLGPKQFDTLASVDRELTRTINFGIFAFLAVPLLRALNWVNDYVGNYGWAIIVLTAIINLLMLPLRHKSVVSMRKMQEIQPQVQAIQARYKHLKTTDPQRQKMNVEMMNLYREKGVNPASGCLPMLLTFPVLFAFYSLLSQAIEIRNAPFVGWIHDLSTFDPYYVTPLLMGASMVIQQRMTPSTADPVQQKVFMFMPILFTFMFLWAPSGLVIYWFTSNLWAIGQQVLTNKLIGPPPARPAGTTAKKAGAAA